MAADRTIHEVSPNEPALGPLVILSGPSGSGKSTVLATLTAPADLPIHVSVSATTRRARPGEQEGREYYFWTPERFEGERAAGDFLEWALVHGQYYGTLHREVDPYRRRGWAVILDIDVQGAANVRRQCPDAVSIFLRASAGSSYEERLRRRGTESEEGIQRRLMRARTELSQAALYDHQVVNDELGTAVAEVRRIVVELLSREKHA
jgi:guanylate kinase